MNGNVVLGDASSDTVTVSGPITAQHDLTVNGNVTLGNASSDTVTVSGPITAQNNLTVNGNVTLGDASGNTVTVNGTTSFIGPVTASTQSLGNNTTFVATTGFVKSGLDNLYSNLINGELSQSVAGLSAVQAYLVELHSALYNNGGQPSYPPTYTTWTVASIVASGTPLTFTRPKHAPYAATVTYAIFSGSSFVSLSGTNNSIVTGTAAGSAVIRASWTVSSVTSFVDATVAVTAA